MTHGYCVHALNGVSDKISHYAMKTIIKIQIAVACFLAQRQECVLLRKPLVAGRMCPDAILS